jgi:integrase
MDWLRDQAARAPVKGFRPKHVAELMDRKRGPEAANTVRKNLSRLFSYAMRREIIPSNPARLVSKRKVKGSGYHTWAPEEIDRFLSHYGEGTPERRALLLILFTGASRQDLVKLGRQHVRDGWLRFDRGKTGVTTALPIHPALAEELARIPQGQLLFLSHSGDRPYKPETFGNWFRDACNAAGVKGSAHGLRKAFATHLAEAGASENEIMAALGHATPRLAALYTRAASREEMAAKGMSRLPTPSEPVGNKSANSLKGNRNVE